jgi:glycine/D-amino acid oxidase-like deaminating enzyme
MEARGSIPVSLPHANPTISYWQDPPSCIADLRSTPDLPGHADYVVVGSGISGACIAYDLLIHEPDASVLMLEARQACSGATGRNGGHTKAASYRSFLDHEQELGLKEAIKIARLEYANIRETHAFARKHGIECASVECETIDVICSEAQWELGLKAIKRMRQVMGEHDPSAEYRTYSADEVAKHFLCQGAVGGIEYAAGSLSAYDFTIGILKLALNRELNLQTNTPATSTSHQVFDGRPLWTITTARGDVHTPNLILATNGYTAHLVPKLRGLIVPLQGQIVAQRPGTGMPQSGLAHTYSLIYETGYEYMISRPPNSRREGDIVIGGGIHQLPNDGACRYGNTDDSSLEPTITDYLRRCTSDRFGTNWGNDHQDGRIREEWSGIMGASADGLPYVGAMPDLPGLFISASFNGHGMVWCLKAAQALVEVVLHGEAGKSSLEDWFPSSAWITKERMAKKFSGRKDLKTPGETAFGERNRL